MTKTGMLWIGIVLIVVGAVGVAAVAFVQPGGSVGSPMRGDMDAMFIEEMIPHHEDAIAMAELALTRAEHPEVKGLAEDVIETQSAEIDQMREWYREWYDADVPDFGGSSGRMGGMMGGGMGGAFDLDDLEAAEPFDRYFIEAMVPHHEMGIMMSQMVGSTTSRPELRDLADSIIEGQSAEVGDMREWYDEWY
ncbi:MAG: DUF305 domain-containing protein [Coriobacteriia bacterium]